VVTSGPEAGHVTWVLGNVCGAAAGAKSATAEATPKEQSRRPCDFNVRVIGFSSSKAKGDLEAQCQKILAAEVCRHAQAPTHIARLFDSILSSLP
jgi:hypothetical protein